MRTNQRGIAIIATAVSLTILIPVLGLGVDTALLWAARTKLNSACQSAALATARNLGVGATVPDQIAYATSRGEAFFQANFDATVFGADPVTPVIRIVENSVSNLEVSVTAQVSVRLFFMRFLGSKATEVYALGRINRHNVAVLVALDTNLSTKMCLESLRMTKNFTNSMLGGRDQVGVSVNGTVIYPADSRFKEGNALWRKLDGVSCAGGSDAPVTLSMDYPDESHITVSLTSRDNPVKSALTIKVREPAELSQAFSQLSSEILFTGR